MGALLPLSACQLCPPALLPSSRSLPGKIPSSSALLSSLPLLHLVPGEELTPVSQLTQGCLLCIPCTGWDRGRRDSINPWCLGFSALWNEQGPSASSHLKKRGCRELS